MTNEVFLTFEGALGDAVVLTCVFSGLLQQGRRIYVSCPEYSRVVLEGHPAIERLHLFSHPDENRLLEEQYRQLNVPVIQCLELPIYIERDRVVFNNHEPRHLCQVFCEKAGVPYNEITTFPLAEEHLEWGNSFGQAILFHTSSQWSIYKNWPPLRWQTLAFQLSQQTGLPVYEINPPGREPSPGMLPLNAPSLQHAAAAVKACKLMIGLDSAFNHISQALQKPSIILWGPTHPHLFGYRQNINLVNGMVYDFQNRPDFPFLNCQPCHKGVHNSTEKMICRNVMGYPQAFLSAEYHSDPVIHTCMAANSVEAVYYQALKFLGEPG